MATHALGEMTIGQMTHCWYQWTNDDHFVYQGFPNSAKRWELGIPPLEAGESYILLEGRIFLIGLWEPEEEWSWKININWLIVVNILQYEIFEILKQAEILVGSMQNMNTKSVNCCSWIKNVVLIHCSELRSEERWQFQVKICLIHARHKKPKLVFIAVHKCKEKCKTSPPSCWTKDHLKWCIIFKTQ